MAVFGWTWSIPAMIGPWSAGLIMDNFDPNYVWYIGGALCVVAVFAFLALHLKLGSREQFQPAPTE
jgi:MFS family permease